MHTAGAQREATCALRRRHGYIYDSGISSLCFTSVIKPSMLAYVGERHLHASLPFGLGRLDEGLEGATFDQALLQSQVIVINSCGWRGMMPR